MQSPSTAKSRRTFLQDSCVMAGTAATALGVQTSAHAAGSDRLKIALVGCGGRGTGAASNCLRVGKHVQLVAMADVYRENALKSLGFLRNLDFGDQIDVSDERVFSGFDAYKDAIASGVDMVLLCTPPGFRPIHYRAAVQAGKHVFLEKPVCVDAGGYRSLLDTSKLADQKNRKVCVGHQMRHEPKATEIVKRIRDGGVGTINLLEVHTMSGYHARGKFDTKRPDQTEMDYQLRNWHAFLWLSGDILLEGGFIHFLDLANWIKGTHPVEVQAVGGRQGPRGPEYGQNFDHHAFEYFFADGTKLIAYRRNIPGCWRSACTIAHGSKGVGGYRVPAGILTTAGRTTKPLDGIIGKNPWTYRGVRGRGHYDALKSGKKYVRPINNGWFEEHVQWVDAITNDKPFNEAYWGGETSMTVILGRMASYSGQLIRWDEAVAKGPSIVPEQLSWDMDPPVVPDESGNYPLPIPGVYRPF